MIFADITLITEDVLSLVEFYEKLYDISIEKNEVHTQFEIGLLRITLYSQRAAESDMNFHCQENARSSAKNRGSELLPSVCHPEGTRKDGTDYLALQYISA
jgi:hypothetical protein